MANQAELALQKCRAQFALAARYVYLAASAYDDGLNFLGTDSRAARDFFTDIIHKRSLGVMVDGLAHHRTYRSFRPARAPRAELRGAGAP